MNDLINHGEDMNPETIEEEITEAEADAFNSLESYRDGYLEGYEDGVEDGRSQGQEAALFRVRMAFRDNYDPEVRLVVEQLAGELTN